MQNGWRPRPFARKAVAAGAILAGIAMAIAAVFRVRRRQRRFRSGEIQPLRSLWTTVDGCRVHAFASPALLPLSPLPADRLPVVLVHGFGVSSRYFVSTAQRLATSLAVYAPDLPGHGKSDTPHQPLDIPQLADALIAWMDQACLRRVSLVGNSMGCQIAVDAAVRYPDRVDRLVLIGPAGDPAARTVTAQFLRLLRAAPYERFSLNLILMVDYLRMAHRLIPEFRAMLRYPLEDMLPYVAAPSIVARGEHDPVAPLQWCEQVCDLAGSDRLVVVAGWGHAVHYSAPRRLVEAIRPFLSKRLSSNPVDGSTASGMGGSAWCSAEVRRRLARGNGFAAARDPAQQ